MDTDTYTHTLTNFNLLVYTTHLHDPLTGTHTTHLHEEREREDGGQEGLWGPAHEQRSHDQQDEGEGDRPHRRDDEARVW